MLDLTVLYYTANFINTYTGDLIRENLLSSIGSFPLISISHKPMNFGYNICVGDIGRSNINIYKQVLIGAKEATTKYVALCEDDSLYTQSHFTEFRPNDDEFAYNFNRWSIYTWSKPPFYSKKDRRVLSQCIAPRELVIEATEERFAKYPDVTKIDLRDFSEYGKYEHNLGVTIRKTVTFQSTDPTVVFSHPDALGFLGLGIRKKPGHDITSEIPYWGSANDLLKKYFK